MQQLKKYELDQVIREVVQEDKPFLGICLGLQLLFEGSEESDGVEGLHLLDGEIVKIPEARDLRSRTSAGIHWISRMKEDCLPD